MNYLINHRRLKKKFNSNELNKYLYKPNRIVQFPQYSKNYYKFFNIYAKKNYKLIKNDCLINDGGNTSPPSKPSIVLSIRPSWNCPKGVKGLR